MVDIDIEKFYSPRKLVQMKIVPWGIMTFNRRLKEAKWNDLFNPIVETRNGRTLKYIKGDRIIMFLELAANGKLNVTDEKN